MKHGSLFSGIGGFDLAAEWAGWENVLHCEINPFCRRVLKHYWPNAKSYEDIKSTDFTIHRGAIDVLTGGFPCQPYSAAGKRLGKEDERHLWPEMLRAIREIQPGWVVGENVRGLTNWNGGLVFDEVQAELEAEGYEVLPFLLPAAGVGAPHRRDRIWFVAHAGRKSLDRREADGPRESKQHRENSGREEAADFTAGRYPSRNAAHPDEIGRQRSGDTRNRWTGLADDDRGNDAANNNNKGFQGSQDEGEATGKGAKRNEFAAGFLCTDWQNFPTVPPLCGGDDGLSRELDGITFSKWRNESIKAYGNAVVPQIPYRIFKAIEAYEKRII